MNLKLLTSVKTPLVIAVTLRISDNWMRTLLVKHVASINASLLLLVVSALTKVHEDFVLRPELVLVSLHLCSHISILYISVHTSAFYHISVHTSAFYHISVHTSAFYHISSLALLSFIISLQISAS